ncbi:MAG: response regulator [Verrucomicrobiae bacterium]|nr:response regulator [Verrucomicrobiae bacterium]
MSLFGSKATDSQLLRAFEQRCSAGLFAVARDEGRHVFITANQRFREQFDLPGAGIEGKPVEEFIGGETGMDFRSCLDEAVTKRRRIVRRVSLQRVDEPDWFLLHLDPDTGTGPGEPDLVYGLSLDVTHTTRAEAAMNSAFGFDKLLGHSVDYMTDPVAICDVRSEGVPVIHCNQAFTRAFGYSRNEIVGRDPIFLLFRDRTDEVTDLIERSWHEGKAVWQVFPVAGKRGVLIESQVVFDFYRSDEGRISFLKMTFLDSGGGQSPLDRDRHLKMQVEELLVAAGSIINDFNNLLALIAGKGKTLPYSLTQIIDAVSSSRQSATQAADIVFNLLRGDRRAIPTGGAPVAVADTRPPQELYAETVPVMEPAAPVAPAAPTAPAKRRPTAPVGAGRRILVVDDEPFIRVLLRDALVTEGYEVDVLASGEEVLDLCRTGASPYAAIVLDYTLGGINGLEIASALRKSGQATPVLLISGYLSQDIAAGARAIEALALMPKPFQPKELADRIARLIATRR